MGDASSADLVEHLGHVEDLHLLLAHDHIGDVEHDPEGRRDHREPSLSVFELVVSVVLLRDAGQLVECGAALDVTALFVGEYVVGANPPVLARAGERDLAAIEQSNEVLPG